MFDGELKSQGLSAANANQIKVFQGSLVKCFEFAGKALHDALANTDEDADVFQEESFGLKLEGEVGTAFANIQKISSFSRLGFRLRRELPGDGRGVLRVQLPPSGRPAPAPHGVLQRHERGQRH
jgi:hypothetical protein